MIIDVILVAMETHYPPYSNYTSALLVF